MSELRSKIRSYRVDNYLSPQIVHCYDITNTGRKKIFGSDGLSETEFAEKHSGGIVGLSINNILIEYGWTRRITYNGTKEACLELTSKLNEAGFRSHLSS